MNYISFVNVAKISVKDTCHKKVVPVAIKKQSPVAAQLISFNNYFIKFYNKYVEFFDKIMQCIKIQDKILLFKTDTRNTISH